MRFDSSMSCHYLELTMRTQIPSIKDRFISAVAYPLNLKSEQTVKESIQEIPIQYRFKRDPHFFDRVEERKVNRKYLGSLFTLLFDEHYCELLYLFNFYKSSLSTNFGTKTLEVCYKDVSVIFLMHDESEKEKPAFALVPMTTLKGKDVFKSDFIILLDKETSSNNEMLLEAG